MMNVLREATTVTLTPSVPTRMVALHVNAGLDSQEMESLAQVSKTWISTSVCSRQKILYFKTPERGCNRTSSCTIYPFLLLSFWFFFAFYFFAIFFLFFFLFLFVRNTVYNFCLLFVCELGKRKYLTALGKCITTFTTHFR